VGRGATDSEDGAAAVDAEIAAETPPLGVGRASTAFGCPDGASPSAPGATDGAAAVGGAAFEPPRSAPEDVSVARRAKIHEAIPTTTRNATPAPQTPRDRFERVEVRPQSVRTGALEIACVASGLATAGRPKSLKMCSTERAASGANSARASARSATL